MKAIAIGVFAVLVLTGADQLLTGGRYTRHANDMAHSMARGFGIH